eukprot:3819162-Pleurochrysis_carterae.AAC.1
MSLRHDRRAGWTAVRGAACTSSHAPIMRKSKCQRLALCPRDAIVYWLRRASSTPRSDTRCGTKSAAVCACRTASMSNHVAAWKDTTPCSVKATRCAKSVKARGELRPVSWYEVNCERWRLVYDKRTNTSDLVPGKPRA